MSSNQKILKTPDHWISNVIDVALIGCGGNGSEALDILTQFDAALKALGHSGLSVTAYDGSVVRSPNLVRQRFWPHDVGQFKSSVLINRYNIALGLNWRAVPENYIPSTDQNEYDMIISAVDLPSVRTEIADCLFDNTVIWLDMGNAEHHGQAVLGRIERNNKKSIYPHVLDHYEEIRDMADDVKKSCSSAESLASQGMLVNRTITCSGMNMVWDLLRHGETTKNMSFINLESGEQSTAHFISP